MSQPRDRKQTNHTFYDSMVFPDYTFAEFPAAVPYVNGKVPLDAKGKPNPYDDNHKAHPVVIVNNQAELDELLSGDAETVPVNPNAVESAERVRTEEDEREALFTRAEQLGVKVDKRWSTERIQKAIDDAEKPEEPVL